MIKAEFPTQSDQIPGILHGKPMTRGLESSRNQYEMGLFELHHYQHRGEPFTLKGEDVIQDGDHYLELHLYSAQHDPLGEIAESLQLFSSFLKENNHVHWLVGTTWLGTVANGRLIERFGFTVTDHTVDPNIAAISVDSALKCPSNALRVDKSNPEESVRFVYASRKSFLASR